MALHNMRSGATRVALAALLALGPVTLATPSVAVAEETSAELQTKLDDAKGQLNNLFLDVLAAQENCDGAQAELDKIDEDIDKTQADIEEKQAKVAEQQSLLSDRVVQTYKTGGVSLLQLVCNSGGFSELLSQIHYANKIFAQDAKTIDEVNALKAQLERQHAELKEQQTEQAKKVDELKQVKADADAAASDMQSYVDSLDAQVAAKLKEEQEAAAAEAAARAQAYQQQNQQAAESVQNQNQQNQQGQNQNQQPAGSGSSAADPNAGTAPDQSSGGLTDAQRSTILAAARSCIGTPYVLGAYSPGVAIDCSGLTKYAYAAAGINIPHQSELQRGQCTVKPISQCKPGDMVFWYGHVAIYAGNGMIVHANYGGVEEAPIYGSYLGGGNPFE